MLWLLSSLVVPPAAAAGTPEDCPSLARRPGPAEGKPGERRFALVVGVGDYAATVDGKSIDIPAASTDARDVQRLLVDTFGFPRRNVCVLRDAEATRERFFGAYDATFGEVVAGDEVVLYFAGHGSRTPGGDQTYLMHDSRTGRVGDVTSIAIERRMVETYRKTSNVTVLIDASHGGGPFEDRPVELVERWVPPAADAPTEPLPDNPRIAVLMPNMVWLHAAPDGMPALERGGHGVFTAGLVRALRERPVADWDQVFHDVTRWTAALHSWQQPTAGGDLTRRVWTTGGPATTWSVASVAGNEVALRGVVHPGVSEGALLEVGEGEDRSLVRLSEVDEGLATGTVVSGPVPDDGRPASLAVPGRDLTAVEVGFQGPTGWVRSAREALGSVVEADPVLTETVRFVERGADFVLRPGVGRTIDLVGADGVRRNRLAWPSPVEGSVAVAEALGMYARQAALLALSGEVSAEYPRDVFELRILPSESTPSCERTPYVAPEGPVPWTRVPMCSPVKLAIRLRETPRQPLHLGIVYLSGNGNIDTWPPKGRGVSLSSAGDEHVEVLGWVTPPLHTPDRILVFGTHRRVDWSRLQGKSPRDELTRGLGDGDFFVAAVVGTRNRGAFVRAGHAVPAFTSSLVSVEVTADPERWTPREREDHATCQRLRKTGCVTAPAKD